MNLNNYCEIQKLNNLSIIYIGKYILGKNGNEKTIIRLPSQVDCHW